MASMWEHITPLTSCPALQNKTGTQEKRGVGKRKEGASKGRSDLTPAAGRTVQLSLLGNRLLGRETPEGSSAPGLPQELLGPPGCL